MLSVSSRKSERKHFRVSVGHYLTAEQSSIASPQSEEIYWLHCREGRSLGANGFTIAKFLGVKIQVRDTETSLHACYTIGIIRNTVKFFMLCAFRAKIYPPVRHSGKHTSECHSSVNRKKRVERYLQRLRSSPIYTTCKYIYLV